MLDEGAVVQGVALGGGEEIAFGHAPGFPVWIEVYFKRVKIWRVQYVVNSPENAGVQMGQINGKSSPQRRRTSSTQDGSAIQTRAVIYCRVSTTDQSCERQERDLTAFANRAGYEIVGVIKETASGLRTDRLERTKVIHLARDRRIDAVLVTELTRWGRSTTDLLSSLHELAHCGVSVIAQTGLQFDLASPQGKLFASLMAALAEFERDLLRERVRCGIAAARARGVQFGRQPGQRVKADRMHDVVLERVRAGDSYRVIARALKLDKDTVGGIVRRARLDSRLPDSRVESCVAARLKSF